MTHIRRWVPDRRLVLVVDGGFAAVPLTLAHVKNYVTMVSRLRWAAALSDQSDPQPRAHTGPNPRRESANGPGRAGQSAQILHGNMEMD